jgi:hypothetical protein
MKLSTILVITLVVLALALFSVSHTTDAGISNFTQMMYRELADTQKDAHEVTRVFLPDGKGSGFVGDNDVRLTEVGSDFFCGLHTNGWRECWRDDQVVSVEFLIVH